MARVPSLAKFQWAAYPAFWAVIKWWAALFASCAIKLLCPLAFDMFCISKCLPACLPALFLFSAIRRNDHCTALHCTSLARIMSASTTYLRAPLRTSWIVASTTRRHSVSGSRACVSTCFFSTSPSPPRRAGWIPARGISTDSFKPGTDHYAKHTRLTFVLALSTSVALGMFLYWRRQSSDRRIWAQDSATAAVDPTPAPTLEKPVPPYEFAEKPFPVVTPEPMSTRRSISFVPAQAGETAHSRPEIYEISEGESSEISKLPKEEAILTSAPHVPPSITRDYPVLLQVPLTATTKVAQLTSP